MNDDLPVIHHCKRHTDVPAGEMILITPNGLRLNSLDNPVHQVVRAAMIEYRAKGRRTPAAVWIWGANVYVPKEGNDA